MSSIRQSLAPSFSPDGKSIAFVSDRSGVPQAWIAGADGGTPRALTSFEDPVTWAQWSPDGAWIAVSVAPGGGMNTQIWLVHPDGSAAKRITAGGKDNNFLDGFSHDGKKLMYASNVRDPKTTDLYLYDVASGAAARVADAQGIGSLLDVSRDGKRALVLRERARGNADLYVVDVGTSAEIHVTPHEGPAWIPSGWLAPDGRAVYFTADLGRDRVALMKVALTGKTAGKPEVLAARDDADLEATAVDEAGTVAALGWNVAGRSELELFDLQKRAATKVGGLPAEVMWGLTFSRDGKRLAFTGASPAAPTDAFVYLLAEKRFVSATDSPHEGVDLGKLVRPELVRYAGKDGLPLSGWLYRPAGGKTPGPIVLSFHGGPEGQERPRLNTTYQALLSRGIAVLAPNVRGSSGFGKRFLNLDNGALRRGAIEDIAATLDHAIASGVADPKRVGIHGGSYGGYMVMAGLTEYPDRFAAGADLYGIVNFETFFANSEPWMNAISRVEYGDPDKEPELLRSLSPIHKLDRVRAATIVLHGANDTNVPVIEAEQVVRGLAGRGVPVEYVLFPDEGHGWRKTRNRTRAIVAVVRWFDRYLRGAGPQ